VLLNYNWYCLIVLYAFAIQFTAIKDSEVKWCYINNNRIVDSFFCIFTLGMYTVAQKKSATITSNH